MSFSHFIPKAPPLFDIYIVQVKRACNVKTFGTLPRAINSIPTSLRFIFTFVTFCVIDIELSISFTYKTYFYNLSFLFALFRKEFNCNIFNKPLYKIIGV